MKRIAIVVGEQSGDRLGEGLIKALKHRYPDCQFEGIGGPMMIAQGFQSHFDMERLAVMGLIDPLKRLPELISIRSQLKTRYSQHQPDLFIGIDAPDFNLGLEKALRKKGVTTAHYVSPSVWAWRQGRVKKIAKAVDLMLTLFPFEAAFYKKHKVAVTCVGHTLADKIPLQVNVAEARERLGIGLDEQVVALLPGSRFSEVDKLAELMFSVAATLKHRFPDLRFLVPSANAARHEQLEQTLAGSEYAHIDLIEGQSHEVMAASNVVLMASGTTTLEAMLLKKPMVITYKVAPFTYWLLRKLIKLKFVGLPNLLANKELAPEHLQDEATVENLVSSVSRFLTDKQAASAVIDEYLAIHESIKLNADETAAAALDTLFQEKQKNAVH